MHLRDFTRSGHPPTLFSAFLSFDISCMVWVLMGALGVFIARDFGLTASQKGILVAIPILGGAFSHPQTASPFSRLLSRDTISLCTPFFPFLGCL